MADAALLGRSDDPASVPRISAAPRRRIGWIGRLTSPGARPDQTQPSPPFETPSLGQPVSFRRCELAPFGSAFRALASQQVAAGAGADEFGRHAAFSRSGLAGQDGPTKSLERGGRFAEQGEVTLTDVVPQEGDKGVPYRPPRAVARGRDPRERLHAGLGAERGKPEGVERTGLADWPEQIGIEGREHMIRRPTDAAAIPPGQHHAADKGQGQGGEQAEAYGLEKLDDLVGERDRGGQGFEQSRAGVGHERSQ